MPSFDTEVMSFWSSWPMRPRLRRHQNIEDVCSQVHSLNAARPPGLLLDGAAFVRTEQSLTFVWRSLRRPDGKKSNPEHTHNPALEVHLLLPRSRFLPPQPSIPDCEPGQ